MAASVVSIADNGPVPHIQRLSETVLEEVGQEFTGLTAGKKSQPVPSSGRKIGELSDVIVSLGVFHKTCMNMYVCHDNQSARQRPLGDPD